MKFYEYKYYALPSYLYYQILVYGDWLASSSLYLIITITLFYLCQYISVHSSSVLFIFIILLNIFTFGKLLLNLYIYNYIIYFGDFVLFKFSYITPGSLSFAFSKINVSFFFLTLWIGLFVNIFMYIYMRAELLVERFMFFLNLFIISMSILLLSANWLTLLLGWELIGITSYLLINFWVLKVSTFKAAFKAFCFNKISDLSLLTALIIYVHNTNSYSFFGILLGEPFFIISVNTLSAVNQLPLFCFFILIAAFCKSAQLGFHVWLPDSMEAPIPASALIHSATLVSAGIFLLLKFWVFIKYCYAIYYVLLFWSTLTSVYGAAIACSQTDLKKTLAYSTISHCGYLMCTLFLENSSITIMYLYVHGIFKAFSFMAFGNIIYSSAGVQDLVRLGNVLFFKKTNYLFLSFSLLNLSAFPLTLGFFFKHIFLENFFLIHCNLLFNVLLFITSSIGFIYSFRIILNLFFSFFKSPFCFHQNSFSNYTRYYRYDFVNIDYILSTVLFIGLFLSLLLILSIYYCTISFSGSTLPTYNHVVYLFSSIKLYIYIFNYTYIYLIYVYVWLNNQRPLFYKNFFGHVLLLVCCLV